MPIIYPTISELARWVIDLQYQTVWDPPPLNRPRVISYTSDRYDPETDTAEIPIEDEVAFGETMIFVGLATHPYGHISRPFFSRSTEYIEDLPGQDVDGNPEAQEWEYDQEIPSPNVAGVEHWSFRPTVTLPAGTIIRARGFRAIHLLKVDQLAYRQGFPIVSGDHTHDAGAEYPPDLHYYTFDREMQVLPVLAVGAFAFQVGQFGFWPYYSTVPDETFALDPENTAWDRMAGSLDTYVSGSLYERIRWSMYPGYRVLKRPETELESQQHFSGVLTTLPPSYGNPWGVPHRAVQFYTITIRYSGLGVDAVQLASTGWLARVSQWEGTVTVERSLDAGVTWPEELAREIASSAAQDSIPTLMRNHHDELFCWWHDADGNAQCDFSKDLGETWSVHTTRPGKIFPRAVEHLGRTLLFLHDGDTTLSIYGNDSWGLGADTLLTEFTLPPQLVQAKVFRTRDGKDEIAHVLAQAAIPGPIAHRFSKDGVNWSPSTQIVVGDAGYPGYALGRRAGFISYEGEGEYVLGRTTETYDEIDDLVEMPEASLAPSQHLALLQNLADDLYLMGWDTQDPPEIVTFFSSKEGRGWHAPV